MTYNIIEVTKSDYRQVAVFTAKLLSELRGTTVSSSNYLVTSQQLIQHNPQWTGFLIYDESVAIGFLSLYQSTALYANGDLGIIQELYVEPSYRNRGDRSGNTEHNTLASYFTFLRKPKLYRHRFTLKIILTYIATIFIFRIYNKLSNKYYSLFDLSIFHVMVKCSKATTLVYKCYIYSLH